ncbi:MAG: oligosaccharide flippase family protein [Planctomycetota bacterium]
MSSGFFRALGAVSQLALAYLVSTTLDQSASGQFFLYVTWFTLLAPMTLLGTQYYAMRRLSSYDRGDSQIAADAHALARLSTKTLLVVAVIAIPLAIWVDQSVFAWLRAFPLHGFALALACAVCLGAIAQAVAGHFHGVAKLGPSLVFSHIGVPLVAGVAIAAVRAGSSQEAILWHLAATAVIALIAVCSWFVCFGAKRKEVVEMPLSQALRDSGNLWLIQSLILVVNWSPIVIAGWLVASGGVAELNIAQRAANLINFVLVVVNFAVAPRLRHAWANNDRPRLREEVRRCSFVFLGLGFPIYLGVCFAAEWIMGSFGDQYRSAALLLRVYATAQLVNVVTGSVNQILTMTDHERSLRNICFGSSSLAIGLSLILGGTFGVLGIAVACSLAIAIQNCAAVLAVRYQLGFWVFDPRPVKGDPDADIDTRPNAMAPTD